MNLKLIMAFVIVICLFVPMVSSKEHCRRQVIDDSVTATDFIIGDAIYDPTSGIWIATIGSRMDINGISYFVLYCQDGDASSFKYYIDVLDATSGKIVATNVNGNLGPVQVFGGYCESNGSICYSYKGRNYPSFGECSSGTTFGAGGGELGTISIPFDETTVGYHEYVIRFGAISPATTDPYSPSLWMRPIKTIKIYVGMPGLLTFNQQKLKRIGYYDKNGEAVIDTVFTLLNKSPFTVIIKDYKINCQGEVTCELEKIGDQLEYLNYKIKSDQPLVIPAKIRFNKRTTLPEDFFVSLEVDYTANGLTNCDIANKKENCKSTSSIMEYKVGLLEKQDFQINIVTQESERECVDAEGNPGRTGPEIAPRINLQFDPSKTNYDCSPINPLTGEENPAWVYCSQKEFLVQLSQRIGEGWIRLDNIKAYEQNINNQAADALRTENGRILSFNAYLQAQDISHTQVTTNINTFGQGLLQSVALPGTVFGDNAKAIPRMKNLVNSINFKLAVGGIKVDETALEVGMYKVTIDMNDIDLSSSTTSTLFRSDNTVNPAANIKVTLEKLTPPEFDWFFYYDNGTTEGFNNAFGGDATSTTFNKTNIQDRGLILNFTKTNTSMKGELYKIAAIPMIARITDTPTSSVSPARFDASGNGIGQSNFTYWTGFASSLPIGPERGCETTSLNPPLGNKALPYRIADENAATNTLSNNFNTYTIKELDSVATGSTMYLETVLYVPVGQDLWIDAPFKISTLNGTTDSNITNKEKLNIITNSSGTWAKQFIIDGTNINTILQSVLAKINDGNVCVIKDTSRNETNWKLYWNQTAVLNSLANVKAQITDANLCSARQQLSS